MLRNIGIVAHINAGKTTLTERILFDSGKQRFLGDVESGTATMDWMVEEQRRGISITAAVTSVDWHGVRIQLIDTPGHVDFTVEVERSLRVLDGAVVILDGIRGVESQTERVWRRADAHGLPSVLFVNKLDRPTSQFVSSVESAARAFGCRPIVLARPVQAVGGELEAVVDIVEGRIAWRSEAAREDTLPSAAEMAAWRQDLVAVCADFDESILRDFVDGRSVASTRMREALRLGTLRREIVPVFAGSALADAGVGLLLDGVRDYLPGPQDRRDPEDVPDGFAALLFKVHVDDDGVSALGFLRVFSGELRPGDRIEVASTATPLVVNSLWRMHSMEREDVEVAGPGDFAAIDLPIPLRTGETLRSPGGDIVLEDMRFPEPVLTMELEPRTSEARGELEARARAMAFEDPTLLVRRESGGDDDGGRLFVSGMGELHLEVFGSRLNRRLSEPARFGRPYVARYETVSSEAEDVSSLRRRFGDCEILVRTRIAVAPAESDLEVTVATGRSADRVCLAVCAGLRSALRTGMVGAYPARDLRVELRELVVESADGADEEDVATVAAEAGIVACRRAIASAGRAVLEPDVDFVVHGPSETFGFVLADLRSRGAEIRSVLPEYGFTEASGRVRLAAVVDYASTLRSMTQGKASVRFEVGRFSPTDTA